MKSVNSIRTDLRLLVLICSFLCCFQTTKAQVYAAIEGLPCSSCEPLGWTISGNPTTQILGNGPTGTTGVTVSGVSGPSPSGGLMTLLSIYSGAASTAMKTTIPGLVIGKKYVVSAYWQGAKLQGNAAGFHIGGSFDMVVAGITQTFTSSDDPLTDNWKLASFTFTATAPTVTLEIKANSIGATGVVSNFYTKAGSIVVDDAGLQNVKLFCEAGSSQVSLNAGPHTNTCPANTVDLNSFVSGTTPAGASLRWFTNSLHSGTPLSSSTITPDGTTTYYAFYYDSANDCYNSDNSTASVTPTVTSCTPECNANAGTITRQGTGSN